MEEEQARGYDTKFPYHVRVNGVARAGFLSEGEAEEWALEHGGEARKAARNPRRAGREPKYTEREKEAVVKAVVEGMTYRDAAEKYGCSTGYVHKLISERRKKEAGK